MITQRLPDASGKRCVIVADNARFFASYARGFKGSTINVDGVSSSDTVRSEFVNSAEGGIKKEHCEEASARFGAKAVSMCTVIDDIRTGKTPGLEPMIDVVLAAAAGPQ